MKLAMEEGVDVIGYLTWGCTDILSSQGEMKKDMDLYLSIVMKRI
jgi:6-phospho-beta-glucosidase